MCGLDHHREPADGVDRVVGVRLGQIPGLRVRDAVLVGECVEVRLVEHPIHPGVEGESHPLRLGVGEPTHPLVHTRERDRFGPQLGDE